MKNCRSWAHLKSVKTARHERGRPRTSEKNEPQNHSYLGPLVWRKRNGACPQFKSELRLIYFSALEEIFPVRHLVRGAHRNRCKTVSFPRDDGCSLGQELQFFVNRLTLPKPRLGASPNEDEQP